MPYKRSIKRAKRKWTPKKKRYAPKRKSGAGTARAKSTRISVFQAPKGIPKTMPLKMSYNGTMVVQADWGTVAVPGQHLSGLYVSASSCNPKIFVAFGNDSSKAVPGVIQQLFPKSTDTPNQSTMRGMTHVEKLYESAYVDSSEIEFRIRIAPGQQPYLHTPHVTGNTWSFFNDFYYGTTNSEAAFDRTTDPADLKAVPGLKRIKHTATAGGDQKTMILKCNYNPRLRHGISKPADVSKLSFGTTIAGSGAKQPECVDPTFFTLMYIPSHGMDTFPFGWEQAEKFPKFFLEYRIRYNVMYNGVKSDLDRSDIPGFFGQSRWGSRYTRTARR